MPARRDKNLRGGHLAEGLGCELLRRVSAVAPVPPTEDVGIDALCTVLRRDGRTLYASNTFAVQIKSASERAVSFDEVSTLWLHDLEIPYFLLSVDARHAKASMYTFEGVFQSRLRSKVSFLLDEPEYIKSHRFLDTPTAPSGGSDGLRFWVGPPVIEFSFEDLQDDALCDHLSELLEKWCEQVSYVIRARRLGIYQTLHWVRGSVPTLGTAGMSAAPDRTEFVRLFDEAAPALSRMRLILDRLEERELEQCIHRVALGACRLGASEILALLLLMPHLSPPMS